jgi:outer membrane receptor protein involved in Fe transport
MTIYNSRLTKIAVTMASFLALTISSNSFADDKATADAITTLDQITVLGRRENLVGSAISASQGVISAEQIALRPITRVGDIAEYVPGMIATQHSGSGKANQYFLRGFNLDHGTDFATFVEDMPVNLRSHGHGQGYSDLNFVIPEMIDEVRYRKGPYYADLGDFASAGAAAFRFKSDFQKPNLTFTAGEYGYARLVSLGSLRNSEQTLSYGVEAQGYDGPWRDISEDVQKRVLVLKGTHALDEAQLRATVMAYHNKWNSADQIPERLVRQNESVFPASPRESQVRHFSFKDAIPAGGYDCRHLASCSPNVDFGTNTAELRSPFSQLDTDVGGDSDRYSLSAGYTGPSLGGQLEASAFAIDYQFNLFSNFTYFLDNPVEGDEFQQFDDRQIYGAQLTQSFSDKDWKLRFGSQLRIDDIDQVGLSQTQARQLITPIRADRVREDSAAIYLDGEYRLSKQLRTYAGLRLDHYRFDVQGLNCAQIANSCRNSGTRSANISSPKLSLIYTFSDALELYAGAGRGFHSNDARGVSIEVDPQSGETVQPVTPLARTEGNELGMRVFLSDELHSTLSLWQLRADSELLFVGDAGTTEASRPSRRRGAEFGLYYFANARVGVDFEASYTQSRFRDQDPTGKFIPGSIPLTLATGVNLAFGDGYKLSAHLRHFGRYPLIEDASAHSDGSSLVNLRLQKQWRQLSASVDLLNALNSKDHDIDYFYSSRLPGEAPEGVADRHFRILEPRSVRVNLTYQF